MEALLQSYFAYGSNMLASEMAKTSGRVARIGVARLDDHRLAFTRESTRWGAGVADVVESPRLSVWGVLYSIDETALRGLDLKEGFRGVDDPDNAYVRKHVTVCQVDGKRCMAITYVVAQKLEEELAPSSEYLGRLIQGAKDNNVDSYYVSFLEALEREPKDDFRRGVLVKPTTKRSGARGTPIVRVSAADDRFKHSVLSVISYDERTAVAETIRSTDVMRGECELDQSVRACLTARSRFAFGFFVRIEQTEEYPPHRFVFKPRTLALPLHRPSMLDSEKNICVLDRKNIALMGVHEGSYVTISVARRKSGGGFEIRTISRRVFSGSTAELHQTNNETLSYPTSEKFYLDLDGRTALGLARDEDAIPVLISPTVWRVFLENVVRYGVTLLVGLLATQPLVEVFRTALGWSPAVGALMTGAFAVCATCVITVVDLRSRVRY